MWLSFLLTLAVSPAADVKLLGSPKWAAREHAQRRLEGWWPLSRPALRQAAQVSPDPEVRERAFEADRRGATQLAGGDGRGHTLRLILDRSEHAARLGWLMTVPPNLVRADMVDFALKDSTNRRLLALWLIVAPFEDVNDLPWVPNALHKRFADDVPLRLALCELVAHTWQWPDGESILLACDPRLPVGGAVGYVSGLDDVRFWIRGLNTVYDSTGLRPMVFRWRQMRTTTPAVGIELPPEFRAVGR